MKELMFEMNPWWEGFLKEEGIKRNKYLKVFDKNLMNKEVIFVTGLRRVGKSTLLKQFIFKLINEKGINPKRIMYISLDAYLLKDNSIHDVVKEFRKIHSIGIDERIYLFFDEVVYKEDFNLIDKQCECFTCKNYTRAYLHYLIKINELSWKRLLTIHNVHFINNLTKEARTTIKEN